MSWENTAIDIAVKDLTEHVGMQLCNIATTRNTYIVDEVIEFTALFNAGMDEFCSFFKVTDVSCYGDGASAVLLNFSPDNIYFILLML